MILYWGPASLWPSSGIPTHDSISLGSDSQSLSVGTPDPVIPSALAGGSNYRENKSKLSTS